MKKWKLIVTIISCILVLAGVGVGIYFAVADTQRRAAPDVVYHTVHFEGADIEDMQVADGALMLRPTAPDVQDYDFDNFYKDAMYVEAWNFDTDRVYADTTMYARYTLKEYGIRLNTTNVKTVYNKGEARDTRNLIVTLVKINLVTERINLSDCVITDDRQDLNKAGWFTVTVRYKDFTSSYEIEVLPTTEKTVLAYIDDQVYYKDYIDAGNTIDELEVGTPTYVREGYRFGGWYTDKTLDNEYDFDAEIEGNLYLYSKWIEEFKVTYSGIDIPSVYALKNDTYTFGDLSRYDRDGYMLFGICSSDAYRYENADDYDREGSFIENENNLYKDFAIENNHYVVKYSKIVKTGATYMKKLVGKKIYTGNIISNGDIINTTESHSVYAIYEPKTYRVTFTGVEEVNREFKIVTYDDKYGELPNKDTATHKFSGWKLRGESITSDTIVKIIKDETLEAQLQNKANIGHVANVKIDYIYTGDIGDSIKVFNKNYYDKDGNLVEEIFYVGGDQIVEYLRLNTIENIDDNTFVFNNKTFVISDTQDSITCGEEALVNQADYFVYETATQTYYIELTSASKVKIYNRYTSSKYSYDSARNMIVANEQYDIYNGFTYEEMIDKFADEYIFGRFANEACTQVYAGGEVFARALGSDFYDKWEAFLVDKSNVGYYFYRPLNRTYHGLEGALGEIGYKDIVGTQVDLDLVLVDCAEATVYIELNGGQFEDEIQVRSGVGYLYPDLPIPTREGYKFDGWFTDGNFTTKIDDSVTVKNAQCGMYARWIALNSIYVTVYNEPQASEVDKTLVFKEGDVYGDKLPAAKSYAGYTFDGWYTDSAFTNPVGTDDIVVSQTLYAKYVPMELKVTLDYGELPIGYGIRYLYYGESYGELVTATKDGYVDGGWYFDEEYTQPVYLNSKVTKTENHTIYHRLLEIHTITVLSDVYGASGEAYTYDVAYTKYILLPNNNFTRQNYEFIGWYWDVNNNGIYDQEDMDADTNNGNLYKERTVFYLTVNEDVYIRARWARKIELTFGTEKSIKDLYYKPEPITLVESRAITMPNIRLVNNNVTTTKYWVYILPNGERLTVNPNVKSQLSDLFKVYLYNVTSEDYATATIDEYGVFSINNVKFTYLNGDVYIGTKDARAGETFSDTDKLEYDVEAGVFKYDDYEITILNNVEMDFSWMSNVTIQMIAPNDNTALENTFEVSPGSVINLNEYIINVKNASCWILDKMEAKTKGASWYSPVETDEYSHFTITSDTIIKMYYKALVHVKFGDDSIETLYEADGDMISVMLDRHESAIAGEFKAVVGTLAFDIENRSDFISFLQQMVTAINDTDYGSNIVVRNKAISYNTVEIKLVNNLDVVFEDADNLDQYSQDDGSIKVYQGQIANVKSLLDSRIHNIKKIQFLNDNEEVIKEYTANYETIYIGEQEFRAGTIKIYFEKYVLLETQGYITTDEEYKFITLSQVRDIIANSEDKPNALKTLLGLDKTIEEQIALYGYAIEGYDIGYTTFVEGFKGLTTTADVLNKLKAYLEADWSNTESDNKENFRSNRLKLVESYRTRDITATIKLEHNNTQYYSGEYIFADQKDLYVELGEEFEQMLSNINPKSALCIKYDIDGVIYDNNPFDDEYMSIIMPNTVTITAYMTDTLKVSLLYKSDMSEIRTYYLTRLDNDTNWDALDNDIKYLLSSDSIYLGIFIDGELCHSTHGDDTEYFHILEQYFTNTEYNEIMISTFRLSKITFRDPSAESPKVFFKVAGQTVNTSDFGTIDMSHKSIKLTLDGVVYESDIPLTIDNVCRIIEGLSTDNNHIVEVDLIEE